MSENVIKISTLLKEVIAEVGDLRNIEPVPYDKGKGTFEIEYGGKQYRGKVTFTKLDQTSLGLLKLPAIVNTSNTKEGYNVGYSVEGVGTQALRSNLKVLLSVLKAVSLIAMDHILKFPNAIHLIFAESKTEAGYNDQQKLAIYQQILGHNLPKGFRIGKAEIEGVAQGLFIVKNN